MEARATLRNLRISPRKVRLVLDLIRNMDVATAFAYLDGIHRKAVDPVRKVLKSAIANAENNFEADVDELVIREAYVNEGATLKRFRPRAMGRATPIRKRTSHVTLVVGPEE